MRNIIAAVRAQLRMLSLTPVSLVTSYLTPLALAVVIISLNDHPTEALVIGAAVAAIWNTLLVQAFLIVAQERSWGTLELLVAAPAGLTAGLLGRLVGALLQSLIAAPLIIGFVLIAAGTPTATRSWQLVAACIVLILAGLAAAALLHMALLIRYRPYSAFINAVLPLSIVLMGLFLPADEMPYGIGTVGRIFAPMWALQAIRDGMWQDVAAGTVPAAAMAAAAAWYLSHIRRWLRTNGAACKQ